MKAYLHCRVVFLLSLAIFIPAPATADDARELSAQALEAFHQAADQGDADAYLALLTEDVVFLGSDDSERWQGAEFREFVRRHFVDGKGWTYIPVERHIVLSPDGNTAFFDEKLDHVTYGRCRGSGALLRLGSGWRIAHYNLTVPIPNSMLASVAAGIKAVSGGAELQVELVEDDDGSVSIVEMDVVGEDASELVVEEPAKNCGKRFKTNSRAKC
jgi:ketosteroid isomerase-like protein